MNLSQIFEKVVDIAENVARINATRVDKDALWPEDTIRALQKAGLAGLVIPTLKGGLGHGLFALARVCEILAKECSSSAICFGMHCVGTAVIAAKATQLQQKRYIDPINQGKHLTTLALSELGTGSHFYFPETQIFDSSRENYLLSGRKDFITNGKYADSYVISVVGTEPNAPLGKFSCVILEKNCAGIKWGQSWNGLGLRGNSSVSLIMKDVNIPKQNLLGNEGDQLWYVFEAVVPYFLMAMSGSYLGIATAALNEVKLHVQKRRYTHSGMFLGQQSLIQSRLGALWAKVERSRRLIYLAANQGDTGDIKDQNFLPAIFSAKAEISNCVVEVTNEAMTMMGGSAYSEDSKISRLLRDSRASQVMAPTTDLLRIWTGRALLGQPLLGEII